MTSPALLLLDLQNDFLRHPELVPSAPSLIAQTARILNAFRTQALPIIHVRTTISSSPDRCMLHWKKNQVWHCLEGSVGQLSPSQLCEISGEVVLQKSGFSASRNAQLESYLLEREISHVYVAGLFLHTCVRVIVMDLLEYGVQPEVIDGAVGSYDSLHDAVSRRFLEKRCVAFVTICQVLERIGGAASADSPALDSDRLVYHHHSPAHPDQLCWVLPSYDVACLDRDLEMLDQGQREWEATAFEYRRLLLKRAGEQLRADSAHLIDCLVMDIGKPRQLAAAELKFALALLDSTVNQPEPARVIQPHAHAIRRPLGVIAAITPFNNALALVVSKLVPALLFGNTVALKPAAPGFRIARLVVDAFYRAGFSPAQLHLFFGDGSLARALFDAPAVAGISLTGGLAAGASALEASARRLVPLQGELGGNNASIVWPDCDLGAVARAIAEAAFSFAGQRCTAGRRVIVAEAAFKTFVERLEMATAALPFGDPSAPDTLVGPLISAEARERIGAQILRAAEYATVWQPGGVRRITSLPGWYLPPTLVACDDRCREIVLEESFGPVLVIQSAPDFEYAVRLLDKPRQGLVASLFSNTSSIQQPFLRRARAGILKVNQPTADAVPGLPFGGWKASGFGPAEHGCADLEFYTRFQTIYHTNSSSHPLPETL